MNTVAPSRSRPSTFARLSPWFDFDDLQHRLDRAFGGSFPALREEPMQWLPAIDLKELEGEFVLSGEFPGMSEKDISVDIEQNTLTLRGEKKAEREEEMEKENGGRWHLIERSFGSFRRSFTLPSSVDASGIKARFEDGVLTVHMPKRKESSARRIAISAEKK
jgi:HSP20 family protein